MAKTLIKIVLALLVAHAAFRVGNSAWNYYRYEDALQELAQFSDRSTEKQLCDQAMSIAADYGVPIAASGLTIRKGSNPVFNCEEGVTAPVAGGVPAITASQLTIQGIYTDRLQVLPGYFYPWEFRPSVTVRIRL
jgi:hypothetical protein